MNGSLAIIMQSVALTTCISITVFHKLKVHMPFAGVSTELWKAHQP